MTWKPITEAKLWDLVNAAEARMSIDQQRLWDWIRILPEKWRHHPYGDAGGGFWAVGVIGRIVIWYNDIEEGFNSSRYSQYGIIADYWCNQDDLELTIQGFVSALEAGSDPGHFCGLPASPVGKLIR